MRSVEYELQEGDREGKQVMCQDGECAWVGELVVLRNGRPAEITRVVNHVGGMSVWVCFPGDGPMPVNNEDVVDWPVSESDIMNVGGVQ